MNKIITITTDFGIKDEYVASIKGVILSIFPEAKIIDTTHKIPPQNISKAALILRSIIRFFPADSFHLVVVDPGVGSKRDVIIIKTKDNKFLIGPDNGVLYPAAKNQGIKKIIKFENKKYTLPHISNTFHGRDIMGPITAYLAKGEPLENFGSEIKEIIRIELNEYKVNKNEIIGSVIDIDSFGNIITNIPKSIFNDKKVSYNKKITVMINGKKFVLPYIRSFSEVNENEILGYIGSKDFFEIGLNKNNFAYKFGIKYNSKVRIIID